MATERRMRLKRGKAGDTGVQLPPPAPEGPNSGERSPFDEEMVEKIVNSVDTNFWSDGQMETLRRAIRLTMGTQAMTQLLHPPVTFIPPPPATPPARTPGRRDPDDQSLFARNPPTVAAIAVDIESSFRHVNMMGSQMQSRVHTGQQVQVTVNGSGDPREMLRLAVERFYDGNITTIRTNNRV